MDRLALRSLVNTPKSGELFEIWQALQNHTRRTAAQEGRAKDRHRLIGLGLMLKTARFPYRSEIEPLNHPNSVAICAPTIASKGEQL